MVIFIEHILCTRHYAKYFTWIISFNLPTPITLLLQMRQYRLRELNRLPNTAELMIARVGIWTRPPDSRSSLKTGEIPYLFMAHRSECVLSSGPIESYPGLVTFETMCNAQHWVAGTKGWLLDVSHLLPSHVHLRVLQEKVVLKTNISPFQVCITSFHQHLGQLEALP